MMARIALILALTMKEAVGLQQSQAASSFAFVQPQMEDESASDGGYSYDGTIEESGQNVALKQNSTGIGAWRELVDKMAAGTPRADKYGCSGGAYDAYLRQLPFWKDPMSDLTLPPNKKILFYGSSYVDNLWLNIYIANIFHMSKETEEPHCDRGGTRTYSYTNGAEVVVIENSPCFQTFNNTGHLKKFLKTSRFDSAFFMEPHLDCYFDLAYTKAHGSSCEHGNNDFLTFHKNGQIFWDIISPRVNGPTFQVERWENRGAKMNNGSTQHGKDRSHYIDASKMMMNKSCKKDDEPQCKNENKLFGHQCVPSYLTIVAGEVVGKMKSMPLSMSR